MNLKISDNNEALVATIEVVGPVDWSLAYTAGEGNVFNRDKNNRKPLQLGTASVKAGKLDNVLLEIKNPTGQTQKYSASITYTQGATLLDVWQAATNQSIDGEAPGLLQQLTDINFFSL